MDNEFNTNVTGGGLYSSGDPNKEVMTMGNWLLTLLVLMIPCVNLIMCCVWGFGSGNENRKNFCRAYLIFMAIGVILSVVLWVTMIGAMVGSLS